MKQLAKKAYETPDVIVNRMVWDDVITSSPNESDYITQPDNSIWNENFWGGSK